MARERGCPFVPDCVGICDDCAMACTRYARSLKMHALDNMVDKAWAWAWTWVATLNEITGSSRPRVESQGLPVAEG